MSTYSNAVCDAKPVRDVTPIERVQNEQQNQIESLESSLANFLGRIQPISREEGGQQANGPVTTKLGTAQCAITRRIETTNERLALMIERVNLAIHLLEI